MFLRRLLDTYDTRKTSSFFTLKKHKMFLRRFLDIHNIQKTTERHSVPTSSFKHPKKKKSKKNIYIVHSKNNIQVKQILLANSIITFFKHPKCDVRKTYC